jgi:hypothetical protein
MLKGEHKGIHVRRRDFIKTTAMASMVAGLPGTGLAGQDAENLSKPKPNGTQIKLVCINDSQAMHEQLIESIKSFPGTEILHIMVTGNCTKAIEDALFRMNVLMVGPSDFTSPEA